ncbi:hypothetical protein QOM21_21475 [Streptomyces sp. Pv4-95]|uniref:hypothetical protein n=1 Tax=Streptomyces sp. Pv4-95 TaxID=3049543 RepID=UPI0038922472
MGLADQFRDKAERLKNEARRQMGNAEDPARAEREEPDRQPGERGRQGREPGQGVRDEMQDRLGS